MAARKRISNTRMARLTTRWCITASPEFAGAAARGSDHAKAFSLDLLTRDADGGQRLFHCIHQGVRATNQIDKAPVFGGEITRQHLAADIAAFALPSFAGGTQHI